MGTKDIYINANRKYNMMHLKLLLKGDDWWCYVSFLSGHLSYSQPLT